MRRATIASPLDHGRETLGKTRGGGTIPLSMTIGRTRLDSPRFFAVFRDLSQTKKSEGELLQARRQSGTRDEREGRCWVVSATKSTCR